MKQSELFWLLIGKMTLLITLTIGILPCLEISDIGT